MEWKNKKVVLLRLENVLASFPKGKCKPQDVTDIRLEANILDALKTMPSLCRLVILYDDFEPLHEKERLALVKGIEFFLFCLLSVAVESKGPEQRHVRWFDGLMGTLPKGIGNNGNILYVGSADEEQTAKELGVDFVTAENLKKDD